MKNTTAEGLFESGDFPAALNAFIKRLGRNKQDRNALFYAGLSSYHLGEYEKAIHFWEKLRKLNHRELNLNLNIGCAWQNLDRNDLAIRHFKKELALNPGSGEAMYSLGTLYYNSHKYSLALPYLEGCYALKHSVERIIDRLAFCYFKTDQLEKEIHRYEEWLRTHPDDAWCLNNLGAALMHAGQYNRGQLFLEKANRIIPQDQHVRRNLKKVRAIREGKEEVQETKRDKGRH